MRTLMMLVLMAGLAVAAPAPKKVKLKVVKPAVLKPVTKKDQATRVRELKEWMRTCRKLKTCK
jgi:hypothetical protein